MNTSARGGSLDRVLIDLNTQCDFLLPGGALPVANRADVVPRIRRLMNWARAENVPVISSLEAHRPAESFHGLPPHCIDRTQGQRKLPFTLLPRRILLQGDNTLDIPSDPFRRHQQIILTKRCTDFLSNPKADRLINALAPHHWIIFGIPTSRCVKSVVLGLLARQYRVVVVVDACGHWSETDGAHACRQMEAKGAFMLTTDQLISGEMDVAIHSHDVVPQIEDDLEWEVYAQMNGKEPTSEPKTVLSAPDADFDSGNGNGNGNGHSRRKQGENGKNGKRVDRISDIVPPHLIRSRSRSPRSASKARRDLA